MSFSPHKDEQSFPSGFRKWDRFPSSNSAVDAQSTTSGPRTGMSCPIPNCGLMLYAAGFDEDRARQQEILERHLVGTAEFKINGIPGHDLPHSVARWIATLMETGMMEDAKSVAREWSERRKKQLLETEQDFTNIRFQR